MYTVILMTMIVSLAGCQREDASPTPLPATGYTDIAYGKDPAQKMDIYLPEGRNASTKTIFLLHGGAWISGDKKDFASYVSLLKKQLPSYAIVNLNYRLANETGNHFPAQENDILAAVKFVLDKRKEYSISDQYVLLGASAGAHLSLLQAYKHHQPYKAGAVISFFGPTDLKKMYRSQSNSFYQYAMQTLIGGTPESAPEKFDQSSPLFYAHEGAVPTLLLHGGRDRLVPVAHSERLQTTLQSAKMPVELKVFPSEGHGVWSQQHMNEAFSIVTQFLDKHLD
jgi:acetyl esterase/lipase